MSVAVIDERDTMPVHWCIGRVAGDKAKHVLDLASHGTGYFTMETGKQQGNQVYVIYAFLRPMDGPVPDHLTEVMDPHQLRKLWDRYDKRHGNFAREDRRGTKSATPQQVADIARIMGRGPERKDIN